MTYGTFFDYQHAHDIFFKKHGQKVSYKKGQQIVSSIDESPWVFFLVSGVVNATFSFTDGSERIIGFFLPGMSFAKSGSFFKDTGGDLEYTACSDAVLYRVRDIDFLAELTTNTDFDADYRTWLLKTQILLIERIVYQGEPTMQRRYMRWLLFMAKYYGRTEQDGSVSITIPLTQETIANFLHTTRESVSKSLKKLTDSGYIKTEKKIIQIVDIEKIRTVLE